MDAHRFLVLLPAAVILPNMITAQCGNLIVNPGFENGATCHMTFFNCSSEQLGQSIAPWWPILHPAIPGQVFRAHIVDANDQCPETGLNFMFAANANDAQVTNPVSWNQSLNNRAYMGIRHAWSNTVTQKLYMRGFAQNLTTPMVTGQSYQVRVRYNATLFGGSVPIQCRVGISVHGAAACSTSYPGYQVGTIASTPIFTVSNNSNVPTWNVLDSVITGVSGSRLVVWVEMFNPGGNATRNLRFYLDQVEIIPIAEETCPGDLDEDGVIGAQDITIFQSVFGQSYVDLDCAMTDADVNGDGLVGVADLLIILGSYGLNCDQVGLQTAATKSVPQQGGMPLYLMPNPTSGSFQLSTPLTDKEVRHVLVVDASGRSVFDYKPGIGETPLIDLHWASPGMYSVIVQNGGEVNTLRLIKE